MTTGIYRITNTINNSAYIGQSVNIEQRFSIHKSSAFRGDASSNKEWYKALYKAFREYGIEFFCFEIIEECKIEQLDERERFYIQKYDTYNNGYNNTEGGANGSKSQGENHPNHKLTEAEVYYIRECYNRHFKKEEIFQEFCNKIGFSGFHKIWNGITWKKVHMDVYTKENKQYYAFERNSHKGDANGRAILTEQEVYQIRLRKKNQEQMKDVYKDYTQITYASFQKIWYYSNWSHIIV